MDLEKTFKEASYKVWDELEPIANKAHKIYPVREEGLTSMALKAMVNANCSLIDKIEMIPATKEKTHGYDFELCIGKRNKWIRYFVQSKRLDGSNIKAIYKDIKGDQVESLI